jgi:hypothetical protein
VCSEECAPVFLDFVDRYKDNCKFLFDNMNLNDFAAAVPPPPPPRRHGFPHVEWKLCGVWHGAGERLTFLPTLVCGRGGAV